MTDEEIRTALLEKLRREEQIVRRTLDAEKAALASAGRAEEAHKKAYEESIEAQRTRMATIRALTELGWEQSNDQ